jgi:Putative zinc-binding metallo-peptidase
MSSRKTRSNRASRHSWATLSDQELLDVRLKDLDVSLAGTGLEGCLRALNAELAARGIAARAHGWISDEWFSPANTPGISFPFYLAHPRLARLERKMMLEVEGGTRRECMQILRHEAGHVVQHAYGLHRRRRWQQVFGLSSTPYPEYYRPNPASKDFVQHLRRWYGQSHPDEDFAETFAVWLTPRLRWRKRYADWPALAKLQYVDELMTDLKGRKPVLSRRFEVDPINSLSKTLGEYYNKKLEHYSVDAPTAFDRELQNIFSSGAQYGGAPAASSFIRRNRAELKRLTSRWNGEGQVSVDAVLDDMIDRCRVLKLRASGGEGQLRQRVAALLTNKAVHSLYSASRRPWFAV